jgi:hypothetical protein
MISRILIFFIVVTLIITTSCSKPPDTEMALAQQAIDSALVLEADVYVPVQFKIVTDSMAAALVMETEQTGKFTLFRNYTKPREAFVGVDSLAKRIALYAIAKKDSVKVEVTDMLVMGKASLDSATMALKKVRKGKDNRADIELIKGDLYSLALILAEAEAYFNSGKFAIVKTKLETLAYKSGEIIKEIR